MSMNNEQILRSELSYRMEQGRGRESRWARVEGRRDTLLRRHWRKVRQLSAD